MIRLALAAALALALAAPSRAALFKSKPKAKPATAPVAAPPGPFDPLTADELRRTADVLRGSGLFGPQARFPVIDVQEPAKDELEMSSSARQAFAVVYDSTRSETSEAVVDLGAQKLVSWRLIPSAARREPAPEPARNVRMGPPRLPWLGLETDGRRFRWRGWSFHLAVRPREGVVLHDVRYGEREPRRKLIYRASLSEILDVSTKTPSGLAFLLGARGLASSLAPADAGLPRAWPSYPVDAVFADEQGKPYDVPAAAAVFERPSERGEPELVVAERSACPSGELLFTWTFGADGRLEAAAQALPRADAPPEQDVVAYRVDFEVDGATNSLAEVAAEPVKGSPAPSRAWLPLRSEREARRDAAAASGRLWVVFASSAASEGSGYALIPETAGAPAASLDLAARRAAPFAAHALWVTRYRPDELHAAGDYPGLGAPADGLERWTRRDDSLEAADLVLWPAFALTTLPPAAPRGGFVLLPFPFLKR